MKTYRHAHTHTEKDIHTLWLTQCSAAMGPNRLLHMPRQPVLEHARLHVGGCAGSALHAARLAAVWVQSGSEGRRWKMNKTRRKKVESGEEKVEWRRWQSIHGMLRNLGGFNWVLRRVQKSHTSRLIIDSCPSSIIQYNFLTIIIAIRLGKVFKVCPKLNQMAGSSEQIR